MSYTINGKTYETWSATNQRILDMLINREVYCCMTSEMEYMLSRVYEGDDNNPFDEEDLYNTYEEVCPECQSGYGFTERTYDELTDEQKEMVDEDEDGTFYICDNCGHVLTEEDYNNRDSQPREIYEWWAVSKWFGEKLAAKGCCVIESWGKSYWGREATGQSISLDRCVIDIAKDMGILEGMEH
jgi:hypothetical protein